MIWDFWAMFYEKLWVQKYSLGPTRRCIVKALKEMQYSGEKAKAWNIESLDNNYMDMGCGTGQLLREVKERFEFHRIYGVDYSKKMIEQAICSKSDVESDMKVEYICASVDDLPTLNLPKFRLITCTHSLPYYKNQERAISAMADCLAEGGHLIIAATSVNSFWDCIATTVLKVTTGFAHYPSFRELKGFAKNKLKPLKQFRIKKKWFMPNIVVFIYEKRKPIE